MCNLGVFFTINKAPTNNCFHYFDWEITEKYIFVLIRLCGLLAIGWMDFRSVPENWELGIGNWVLGIGNSLVISLFSQDWELKIGDVYVLCKP